MKDRFAKVKKLFIDSDKARKTKESKEAVDLIKAHFQEHENSKFLVKVLPFANTKALTSAMTHIKGMKTKSAALFSVDRASDKVSFQIIVTKVFIILFLQMF